MGDAKKKGRVQYKVTWKTLKVTTVPISCSLLYGQFKAPASVTISCALYLATCRQRKDKFGGRDCTLVYNTLFTV